MVIQVQYVPGVLEKGLADEENRVAVRSVRGSGAVNQRP